jgi:hypothetical protein
MFVIMPYRLERTNTIRMARMAIVLHGILKGLKAM